MSTKERSARDELLRQQQQLAQQDEARRAEWPVSLEHIAAELKYRATGQSWGPYWPAGGQPGPNMQF